MISLGQFQKIREKWGEKLLILGHYYIPDETIACTDRQGDSLALAKMAASDEKCEAILFCGVHFMAETADILANAPQKVAARGGKRIPVMLPNLLAGCPMANMASRGEVEKCWKILAETLDVEKEVTPVTYVNSSASIKAFCGLHGGIVCTSSNAREVLEWALARKKRVLFLPDQHLGRNTALKMGISPDEMVLWDRQAGKALGNLEQAKVILWNGFCRVHHQMTPAMAQQMKTQYPDAKLIVHPECSQAVVAQSAADGSTSFLINVVQNSQPGEAFVIGTESHLVDRLQKQYPDREIHHLAEKHNCVNMEQNTLDALLGLVEAWDAGKPYNIVAVPEEIAAPARVALENMLRVK
ncbi:MAG: quinolinate synthase NadA [Planctomycetia bacterium]|nr:quinolinate synthase NadA [Planctomycetia bacterium]